MPKCIVRGCTSGYASNPEKFHFFCIPRDPASVKLWKKAINRTNDSVARAGSSVCEKHFNKDEICWKREFLSLDGQVAAVANYKVPRLKKGTLPSKFPWTKTVETVDEPPCHEINTRQKVAVIDPVNKHTKITSVEQVEPPADEAQSTEQNVFRFTEFLATELHLPAGWMKTVCSESKLMTVFQMEIRKIKDTCQMFILKDITLKEDMTIQLRVLGLLLDLNSLNMPSGITDMDQFQDFLTEIDRLSVCAGCAESSVNSEIEELNCTTLKKDIFGTWRVTACSLLIDDKKVCNYCKTAKRTLNKILSQRKEEKGKMGKNDIVLSKEQKMELARLQSKYRSAARAKRLAQEKIKKFKSEINSKRCVR